MLLCILSFGDHELHDVHGENLPSYLHMTHSQQLGALPASVFFSHLNIKLPFYAKKEKRKNGK